MNPEAGPPPPDHNGPNNPLAFRQPKSPTLPPKAAGAAAGSQDAPSLTFKLPTKAFGKNSCNYGVCSERKDELSMPDPRCSPLLEIASTPAKRKFSDSDSNI